MREAMPQISVDNPCLFLTSVTHNRLPVFRTDKFKKLLTDSFDEARKSARFLIFAYIVMADHYHVITDSSLKPSKSFNF
jgi:REP element-mobilizing transposase RayT